ncbi:5-oxoprolinase (ATP-hydrolyzing) [Syntrophobotulus glycolicus DSM 8271]|uniref:5-oxoprolinase (ATP-hydrolyzing) n=1 Tax=Syntrophobotulus glycolicus (strain DSM 8271 / FlGlyR) TaxID=645991 RepID=F0T0K0_SYNGF|nr:oxoprolinase family protein [Syntrophobotulus glycolicus]ADY55065.1 5-oxoprolinase (ATP-hydrolyzing) [Syntrophobotulus glycolicus DSM 8271]
MNIFKELDKSLAMLDELRILAQAEHIIYRQKGESHTADRFKQLEEKLLEAIRILSQE